jgi:hypothetical protein
VASEALAELRSQNQGDRSQTEKESCPRITRIGAKKDKLDIAPFALIRACRARLLAKTFGAACEGWMIRGQRSSCFAEIV